MCEKAIEIQKKHKPNIVDIYVCACSCKHIFYIHDYDIDCFNKRNLENVEPHYSAMVKMSEYGGFVAYYNERSDEYLSYIWLPRQDQLQKMVRDKGDILSQLQAIWIFINSFKKEPHSFEQLWLEAIMYWKYKKIWNGKEWIV